jgi:hypothetical protein
MRQVTCGTCGAGFDLTPALPPSFDCGGCGAEVSRPAVEARPPRPPSGSTRRYLDAARQKPARRLSPAALVVLIAAGVALSLGGVLLVAGPFGSGDAGASRAANAAAPGPDAQPSRGPEPAAVSRPVAAVAAPAPAPAPAPEPVITGSPEMVRFKHAARRAKTAKDHFDAAVFGRAQLDAIRKSAPDGPEVEELGRLIQEEVGKAIAADPDYAPARCDLGHVRWSRSAAESWATSDRTPTELAASLRQAIAAIGGDRDPQWLAGEDAERFGPVIAEAELLFEDRTSTRTSWFYEKARKLALRIEGEIGVYLADKKGDDAFDGVIFRPYLIMVQKDPKQKSVDRAYEIVRLVRTLEDTWRRRYAKEIDFAGSLSAPPIIVLRSRAEYKKYEQRHEIVPVVSAGHYEPADRRMFIYKSSPDEERVVIFHEGTHMLIDHKNSAKDALTQSRQSMWFSEGIAEYFGGHGQSGQADPVTGEPIWEVGRVNDTRIGAMKMARALKQLIKFEDLVKTTRAEWGARNVKERLWSQMIYAQGWALVYFLNHGDGGRYQKDFVEYMKLELAGKSGAEAFSQAFGKHGIDKIEKGYDDFLAYIIKKHDERKIVDGRVLD